MLDSDRQEPDRRADAHGNLQSAIGSSLFLEFCSHRTQLVSDGLQIRAKFVRVHGMSIVKGIGLAVYGEIPPNQN